jgi:hypothetical protein
MTEIGIWEDSLRSGWASLKGLLICWGLLVCLSTGLLDCLSTRVEQCLLFDCICCELNAGDWGLLVCLSTGVWSWTLFTIWLYLLWIDHCLLELNCLIICCELSTDLLVWLDVKFLDVYCVFNVLNVLVKCSANENFFPCVFQTKRSTQIKRLP